MLVLAVGAIVLVVSLFLDWFEPGLSAWTVFEVWDLVLAALALMAVVAVASRLEFGARRPDSWLLIPALVAPAVVVASLLNHPPAAQGSGQDPMIGIWLAFGGSMLMALGALVAIARISVALDHADEPSVRTPGTPTPVTPPAGGVVPDAATSGTPTPGAATPSPATPAPATPPPATPGTATGPTRPEDPPARPKRSIFR